MTTDDETMPVKNTRETEDPPAVRLTWDRVLAWRLERQHLRDRKDSEDLLGVVRDLCGVQAQVMSWAELALWARTEGLSQEVVQNALWERRTLVKTWAMRGTLHLLPADDIALRSAAATGLGGAGANYLKPASMKYHGWTREDVRAVIKAVPEALDGACLTREELGREVARIAGMPDLAEKIGSGWGSMLKPSAYLGHLCFGPSQGRNVTFTRPDQWLGIEEEIEPEDAEEEVFRRYLRVYGPATHQEFARWWGVGQGTARQVLTRVLPELAEVDVEGRKAWALAEDVESIEKSERDSSVILLPGFDQYALALGPVGYLLPEELRGRVYRSKGAWYSPVLVVGGRISGVWKHEKKGKRLLVEIEPFEKLPARTWSRVEEEAKRLAGFLGAALELSWVSV